VRFNPPIWAARASLAALLLAGASLPAATFTWNKNSGGNASGSWTNQANWSGATLPTTTSDAVNFNTLDITADSKVTLDGSQSANAIFFGDTNASTGGNWIINAGSPSSSTLTLGGASPTISVASLGSGKAAAINAIITGTSGLTKTGTGFVQLNAVNTYSGGTILSGSDCHTSIGNDFALGTGLVTVGGTVGDGQNWFNAAGNRTLTNAFEVRTIRWIIDNATVNGVAAGDLTVNGNVLLNTGSSNVRDIYCNMDLTINGNVSVTPASNPMNKQGGYVLTLNGTNTVGGASAVNGGTLIVNGPMNGGARFTVNSGGTLGGTGVFSGAISVASGGNLAIGSGGRGPLTCGGLTSVSGAIFNYAFGATNNVGNGFIKVNGSATLAGALNITDLGGFTAGVYTGLQYSGSVTLGGLKAGIIPGGRSVVVDTNTPGYVLFRILNGTLNPAPGQKVPMDLVVPLALAWLEVPGATAYDVYLGPSSNSVSTATTNTTGVYQGRASALTLNISGLQPNTTYYWRVDSVAANGTLTAGTVSTFTTGAPIVDLMEDTWVATDALNRSLPGLAECGSPRTNRPIGLFYYFWHKAAGFGSGTNWDVSQYLSTQPYTNPHNPWSDSPVFQTAMATYWWGQPELGYYDPSDP
jgi:autotransporter-associated beta strand protein